jgi:putative membrane protein
LSQPNAPKPSQPVVIRPSLRLVRPFYTLSFVLLGLYFFAVNNNPDWPVSVNLFLLVPLALLVWTVVRHIKLRFTSLTLDGKKLRYQTGMLSRNTRTLELAKVQDVGVTQTMLQRILSLGDITVETAGDLPPLAMRNVDGPQEVADFILESARN